MTNTTTEQAYNHALHAYMVLVLQSDLLRFPGDSYVVEMPRATVLRLVRDAFTVGQQASQTALRYRLQESRGVRMVDAENLATGETHRVPQEFVEYDIATAASVISSWGEDRAAAQAELDRLNRAEPCEFCEPFDRLMNGGA